MTYTREDSLRRAYEPVDIVPDIAPETRKRKRGLAAWLQKAEEPEERLSVDTMLENAPKNFEKVFSPAGYSAREGLNFMLTNNADDMSRAISSMIAKRIELEKSENKDLQDDIAGLQYLEKLMKGQQKPQAHKKCKK